MPKLEPLYGRTLPLAGHDMLRRLRDCHILVAGVGGVGSWAVECLARTGAGHITIVDNDTVAPTNLNRQLPALHSTIGEPKVDVLARRMLDINPDIDLRPLRDAITPDNIDSYDLAQYDYVLDAIDTLRCKAALIDATLRTPATLYSSMGAARKLHASAIATARFDRVTGCPLARALRQYFKRSDGHLPRRPFTCVYSPEVIAHHTDPAETAGTDAWSDARASVNGTFCHTTAIFGMTLAGLVIEDLYSNTHQ